MKKILPAFTLIEMLVVMAIFTVISGVILANHSRFNSSVLLGSLAYDVALSVRQAQVYGLSVQTFNSNFQAGYGIHFDSTTAYSLFADVNGNTTYDAGIDSIIQTYTVGQGHAFTRGCLFYASGQSVCSDNGGITFIDIVFVRPNPDAHFSSNIPGPFSSATLSVGSPSGETRTITIASTGQISVAKP